MDYTTTISIRGDGQKVLEQVRLLFMHEGYEVSGIAEKHLHVSGGSPLQSSHGPLHGVSHAEFRVSGGSLLVEAELGGVRKLRNFLYIFPPGLGLFLAVTFYLTGVRPDGPAYMTFVMPFLPVAPWVVISPLFVYIYRKRAIRALDTLLKNLQTVSAE
jgi:hypothetical protein